MRLLATCLAAALGAALCLLASPAAVAGDLPGPGPEPAAAVAVPESGCPAQPGTGAEEAAYAEREAASPEVQEFSGGVVVVYVSLFGVLVVILILILISGAASHNHV